MQPTVIQSSKLRVARPHIVGVSVGLIWPILYMFTIHPADHIGSFFKGLFALCALISGVLAWREARKAWRVFTTPGDWKVTVSPSRFTWEVAIPSTNLPIDLPLTDVEKALRLEVSRTGKDSDGEYTEVEHRFELHFANGHVLTFDRDSAGISPHRVFLALKSYGLAYECWSQDLRQDSADTSKIFLRTY